MGHESIRFVAREKERNRFFRDLTKRVNRYFRENDISPKYNREMIVKVISMFATMLVTELFQRATR